MTNTLISAIRAILQTARQAIETTDGTSGSLNAQLHMPIATMDDETIRAFDNASYRLAAQRRQLNETKSRVDNEAGTGLIDSELEVHDELEQIKHSLRAVRRAILQLLNDNAEFLRSSALDDALLALQKAVAEMYTAATQLQWEIGEHDASYTAQGKPIIATNKEELDRALDLISSRK